MAENQNYLNLFGLIAFFALIAGLAVQYMLRLTVQEYGYPTYSILIFTELLVVSGVIIGITGVVARKVWSNRFFLISSGMFVYSLMFSLGKYFETHRFPFIILSLFTAVLALILLAAKLFFKKKSIDLIN
jgi:hypothetical protein